jgi:hypothetical protein
MVYLNKQKFVKITIKCKKKIITELKLIQIKTSLNISSKSIIFFKKIIIIIKFTNKTKVVSNIKSKQ